MRESDIEKVRNDPKHILKLDESDYPEAVALHYLAFSYIPFEKRDYSISEKAIKAFPDNIRFVPLDIRSLDLYQLSLEESGHLTDIFIPSGIYELVIEKMISEGKIDPKMAPRYIKND